MDDRQLWRLQSDVEYIKSDVAEIRSDIRAMKRDTGVLGRGLRRDFGERFDRFLCTTAIVLVVLLVLSSALRAVGSLL